MKPSEFNCKMGNNLNLGRKSNNALAAVLKNRLGFDVYEFFFHIGDVTRWSDPNMMPTGLRRGFTR